MKDTGRKFMALALARAAAAADAGEVPVGAVIVEVAGGNVIASAHNRTEAGPDPRPPACRPPRRLFRDRSQRQRPPKLELLQAERLFQG